MLSCCCGEQRLGGGMARGGSCCGGAGVGELSWRCMVKDLLRLFFFFDQRSEISPSLQFFFLPRFLETM